MKHLLSLAFAVSIALSGFCKDEYGPEATVSLITNGVEIIYTQSFYYGFNFGQDTIFLNPGDTIVVSYNCNGNHLYNNCGTITETYNGSITVHSNLAGDMRFYATQAGAYSFVGVQSIYTDIPSTAEFIISYDTPPARFIDWGGPMLRVTLQGAVSAASPYYMSTALVDQNLLPTTEPFSALGLPMIGGVGKTVHPNQFDASGDFKYPYVDWVLVELRDPNQPSTILYSLPSLVDEIGNIRSPNEHFGIFISEADSIPIGSYYIAIQHRNHLGVMSAAPINMTAAFPSSTSIYFHDLDFPLWNDHQQFSNGYLACMWAGNVANSQAPDALKYVGANNDRDPILTRIGGSVPTNVATGYFAEDVNLDGLVKYTGSNNDREVILQNIGGGVPTNTRVEELP